MGKLIPTLPPPAYHEEMRRWASTVLRLQVVKYFCRAVVCLNLNLMKLP